MIKFLNRQSNKITISELWQNYQRGIYNFDPPYQRKSIWTEEMQSFLIDTILKNFPIPPIFLHQKIDPQNGATSYDIIDGKQRLSAIIAFIKNKISTTSEQKDVFENSLIAGCMFDDLDHEDLLEYKHNFWRYSLTIEYVDTEDKKLIDNIFDRLNRNGERLRGQELRHSTYYDTPFWNFIETQSNDNFWKPRLAKTETARMADLEFISELLFLILEQSEFTSTDRALDKLYKKYSQIDKAKLIDLENEFNQVTTFLSTLKLKYETWRITGVSHLYGLWGFSYACVKDSKNPTEIKRKIHDFYDQYQTKDYSKGSFCDDYKQSMSSRTKSSTQRLKRRAALSNFCEHN